METVVLATDNRSCWTIVSDDNCPVVRFMSHLVRLCDHSNFFRFVGREDTDEQSRNLLLELAQSPWSLLLVDDCGLRRHGPEAIPFILKNLPSGRLACVAYLIPGTMWLTRQLYFGISRHRNKLALLTPVDTTKTGSGINAA